MKHIPDARHIEEDMQAGRVSLDGYMGSDTRSLDAIINEDEIVLKDLNTTAESIGKVMRRLTRAGMEAQGEPVIFDGFEVEVTEYMGWFPCPYKDNRKFGKRITNVTNLATGEHLSWTDLGIHLIKNHGFFQGIGSPFRLDPAHLYSFLRMSERAEAE